MTLLSPRHASALCALAIVVAGCGQSKASGPHPPHSAKDAATRVAGQGGQPPSAAGPAPSRTGPAPSFGVTPDELPSGAERSPRYGALPPEPRQESRDCSRKRGTLVEPGPVDAAMGLRAMRITLTYCGTGTHRLDGYPGLRALGDDRAPLDVRTLRGTGRITTGVPDPGPHPVALRRGESATAVVVWRNTYTDTTRPAVQAPHLRVVPAPGAPARILTPDGGIDLGSTGRIGTTAWKKYAPDGAGG
ncbi:DUF4232 domain-containing protein [Streptomyces flavofungini]|uniref:DUF4232 domain-containing protein n=1 Tax=Streptomyces flavofungini TaxID=68200 RepID=UPI0025B1A2AD|nr:DUF4232 domain-containing protein [Streptomyces flavofungini]WJV45330.1 DUF4232 domain-containing protein [Streptomyces flavofungini]